MIYLRLFYEFAKIGLFTVGGGMATLPFLQALSEKTGWYSMGQLLDMVAVSESTPGPIGINMATFAGYLTAGVGGSVAATFGMVVPTVALVLVVARFLQTFRNNRYVLGAMYGLRPASAALIAAAGLSVALLTFVDVQALRAHAWAQGFDLRALALGAVLLVLTRWVPKTRTLHPVVFIAASAAAGVVLHMAGV